MSTPFYYFSFDSFAGKLFALGLSLFFGFTALLRLSYVWLKQGNAYFAIVDRQDVKPKLLEDGSLGKHRIVRLKKQGIRLHCVESGDPTKKLMLFVHGFPENWYSWKCQIPEFQSNYHVVAVNMRGYGDSDKPTSMCDYSIDNLVADLVDVIEHFSAPSDKCILVAHDWGGVVAWLVAQQHPKLVDRFIVMNAPHPRVWQTKIATSWRQFFASWYIFFFNLPFLPEMLIKSGDFALLDRQFQKHLTKEEVIIYKYYFGRRFAISGPLNFYRAFLRGYASKEMESKMNAKVEPKTLIIWGDQDTALVTSLVTDSLDLCEDGRVRMVEGGSHWVQLDKPKDVQYHMMHFLEEK